MNKYVKRKSGRWQLTEAFYKLSLPDKYMVIESEDFTEYLLNETFHDNVVLAIIQHSDEQDKENFPVNDERKLHAVAKKADLTEAYVALYRNFDRVFSILERQGLVRGVFE